MSEATDEMVEAAARASLEAALIAHGGDFDAFLHAMHHHPEKWMSHIVAAALSAVLPVAIAAERERAALVAATHPGIRYERNGVMDWRVPDKHDIAIAIREGGQDA